MIPAIAVPENRESNVMPVSARRIATAIRVPENQDTNVIADNSCHRKHGHSNAGMRHALVFGTASAGKGRTMILVKLTTHDGKVTQYEFYSIESAARFGTSAKASRDVRSVRIEDYSRSHAGRSYAL